MPPGLESRLDPRWQLGPEEDRPDDLEALPAEDAVALAITCHLDHTRAYPYGPTADYNLGPFCEPHHLIKHHSRWRVTQPQPGVFEWTSPTGHTSTIEPKRRPPDDMSKHEPPGEPAQPPDTPADQQPDEPPF